MADTPQKHQSRWHRAASLLSCRETLLRNRYPMTSHTTTRLNKYISDSGLCSRRDADRFIEQGKVTINGRRAPVGDQVNPGDQVRVNGQEVVPRPQEEMVFIALNKPVGIVCTTDSSEPQNIQRFVGHQERIFPIGRLDKDSQGLIFMTSNGDLVNRILRAGNNHEKEYLVTVNKPVTPAFIQGMANGVPILGTVTRKCRVSQESRFVFRITLVEGLNRQIRRMCEHFSYEVTRLERTRIMNISLGKLQPGQWRELTQKEMATLLESIRHSSSEAPAGTRKRAKPAAGDRTAPGKASGKPVRTRGQGPGTGSRAPAKPGSRPKTRKKARQRSIKRQGS